MNDAIDNAPDRLLPQDPLLPQLPTALDPIPMRAVFARTLAARGLVLDACAVDRVKYRPRRNLAVSYRLTARQEDGGTVEQRVAARFCAGGDALRRWHQLYPDWADAAVGPGGAPMVLHDAALDMVACWWPFDPKLVEAAQWLTDPRRLAAQLEAVAATWAGASRAGRVLAYDFELAQLVPEDRVSARARIWTSGADDEPAAPRVAYAKADAERRGAVTHMVMQALRQSPAARDGRLQTPEPVLWHPASGLHWQTELPGRALLDAEPVLGAKTAALAGAQLAALHASPVPASRRCSFDALRDRIVLVGQTVALLQPDQAALGSELATALVQGLAHLRGAANVTLHGDLHPRNLLVHEGRLGLIDLDSVRMGPALLDLGDWLADGLYRALLDGRTVDDTMAAGAAFIDGYAEAGGSATNARALAWSVAHSLFAQRVWRCLVNLKPGRFALVQPLLRLARQVLIDGMPVRDSAQGSAADRSTLREAA